MATAPRPTGEQRFKDARTAKIAELITDTITAQGLHLEEIELVANGPTTTLKVSVDMLTGTEQVDLDTIAEVSQAISARFDEDDVLPELESYDLEVSTPGATRPLTTQRHFERNLGRLLEITQTGHSPILARLQSVEDGAITVVEQKPSPKKGMPVKYGDPARINLSAIDQARVQVEFSHTQ
ncbi:ribosome maturation factor RimP [Nesterenkonia sp. E16_7]|uniref:ribosome maturation factor RimP n=1 Tax=unclassified Nesterenkonia TaxID=2629769 RepID=UPI001A933D48|nr:MULTISPECIES: ribosome maturation factor RimP [unclassified Nesterenkonia]MBO0595621.1 ribosome maturation factor RimP [Nesterenkonia sp. E16_10]MBO0598572.1 ribosome maturation factor RimP [Nesterenkonia sp. E16_7]